MYLLRYLSPWGVDNLTTFEPCKMAMMVVSCKREPFDPTGVEFEGHPVKQVSSLKVVGYTFDSKLSWPEMVDDKAKKARSRVSMLRRLSRFLNNDNLKLMYTSFIRPVMEYGSLLYVSAAPSHLSKLDRVQAAAERLGGFQAEPLSNRRGAAIASYALKMLDGKVKPILRTFTPKVVEMEGSRVRVGGLQIQSVTSTNSLDKYKRSLFGSLPKIWSKIPQKIIMQGYKHGWLKIRSRIKKVLNNHTD